MKFRGILRNSARQVAGHKRIAYMTGDPHHTADSKNVNLRGVCLHSNYPDMPNMIFFPDMFDSVENWIPFFMQQHNRFLDYRNIYILYPRNFGNSDYCDNVETDGEDAAADVERFMYANRISTATMAGHGLGARTAALVGCYKPSLVTGLLGVDYAPQDYRYFEFAHSIRSMLGKLAEIDMKSTPLSKVKEQIDKIDASPKIKRLISHSIRKQGSSNAFYFNLPFLAKNFDKCVDWRIEFGLVTSRSFFVFPDYSNRVFLGSNTLSMHKICPTLRGFNHDIITIMTCNDNPEANHWLYDSKPLVDEFSYRMLKFLVNYDGVNPLLWDRSEIANRVTVPVLPGERVDRINEEVTPPHFHHNWKFRTAEDKK